MIETPLGVGVWAPKSPPKHGFVCPGQTVRNSELIFGTDLPLHKRHHVLGGSPPPLFWGKLGGLKFWVVWEGIGQLQAIETILCIVTLLGPRNSVLS